MLRVITYSAGQAVAVADEDRNDESPRRSLTHGEH